MDLGDNYLADPLWQDKVETMPGGEMVLVREIRKALDGEPFMVIKGFNVKATQLPGCSEEAFAEIFDYYENYKFFGLPGGGGWKQELPRVIRILKHFIITGKEIEAWRIEQASKR